MITTVLVLEIIKLSLQLVLKAMEDMPPEMRAAAWAQHQKNLDFWQDIFKKADKQGQA